MGEPHSALQRNRIHRALSRPNLLMGADRELLLVTGLVAIILIFVVLTLYSALFGIAIWIVKRHWRPPEATQSNDSP